jgi:outer membrane protein TolC
MSMKKIKVKDYLTKALGISFLFLITFSVRGQELNEYLVEAGENNPEVRANFRQYLAALERVPQVGSLPDPELSLGVFLRPMETLMGNQRADLSLMQMFPWFGMLRTQKDEASMMANAAYERFRESKNQLYFEVKNTYYQLHQLQNEIEVMEENLEVLRMMERLAIIRYQGGSTGQAATNASRAVRSAGTNVSTPSAPAMSMGGGGQAQPQMGQSPAGGGMGGMAEGGGSGGKLSDVLRLQIQIRAMESQLETLADNKAPLITRFNKLLNREKNASVALQKELMPKLLLYDEQSYIDSVLEDNPMLRMFEAEASAFTKQEEMARLEGRPMIGVGANYMVFSPRAEMGFPGGSGAMEYMPSGMGNNMVMPMVTLTLPIYRKKFKAAQAEARYGREAMELQRENAQNNLIIQLEEVIRDIRDTERKVTLLEDQVELTQQTLDLMVTGYASEGTSFEELLSVQRELLDYRIDLLNAIVNQHTAYAMLDMLVAKEVRD